MKNKTKQAAYAVKTKFEVLADYPGCPFKIGQIIEKRKTLSGKYFVPGMLQDPEDFPHLFKPIIDEVKSKSIIESYALQDIQAIEGYEGKVLVSIANRKEKLECDYVEFEGGRLIPCSSR